MSEIDSFLRNLTRSSRIRRRKRKMKYKHESRKFDRGTDVNPENTQNTGEFFLAASSLNDHNITKLMNERTINGQSTRSMKERILTDGSRWMKYVDANFSELQIVEFGETTGMIICNTSLNFIDYTINSSMVEVRLFGDKSFISKEHKNLCSNFELSRCEIEWVYGSDGSAATIPMVAEKLPISEMYPFLNNETIEQYYDRFLASSASILLLIGPPGTGKTTFIRGLLNYAGKNAIVTYDEKILEKDYIFAHFIEDDTGVMVIEDADNFLRPRSEGNSMMHRFLNVGDGLINIKGKKLIFSTNLPSIKDVDPALVRPGRCFDVVSFENYTLAQAEKLAKKLEIPFERNESSSHTYSLAEVFFKQQNTNPTRTPKMGFV